MVHSALIIVILLPLEQSTTVNAANFATMEQSTRATGVAVEVATTGHVVNFVS